MDLLRRVVAGTAIATVTMLPLADFASAGNKGDGNFCPGRQNSCPSGGTSSDDGGDTTNNTTNNTKNNNRGNQIDECDNRNDGTYLIGGVWVTCNQFDVTNKVYVLS